MCSEALPRQSQNVVACIGGSGRCVGRGRYGGRGHVVSVQVVRERSSFGLGSLPGVKQRRLSLFLRSPICSFPVPGIPHGVKQWRVHGGPQSSSAAVVGSSTGRSCRSGWPTAGHA